MKPGKVGPEVQEKRGQNLVKGQKDQQMNLEIAVAHEVGYAEGYAKINRRKQQLKGHQRRNVLAEQVTVACDVSVVEDIDARIKEDIEQEGKVEQGVVDAIHFGPCHVLDGPVDAEQPEGLDQQVQRQQEQ